LQYFPQLERGTNIVLHSAQDRARPWWSKATHSLLSASGTAAQNHLQTEAIADTLYAHTRLPAVVQGEAVAVIVVAAAMHQPPDSPILLVAQTDDVISCSSLRWLGAPCNTWSMFRLTVSTALARRFRSWYSVYPAFFSTSRASISAVSASAEGSLVIPWALKN